MPSGFQYLPYKVYFNYVLYFIIWSNVLTATIVTILIFVPWKKPIFRMSEMSGRCYVKFVPYVFCALTITDFVVLPAIFMALNLFGMIRQDLNFKDSFYASWFVFYFVVCVSKITEFIFVI